MTDLASVTNTNQDNGDTEPTPATNTRSPKVYKKKEKIPLTEEERHKGWIENLRHEEKTMKDSINKCIDDGLTRDPVRAK